MLAQNDQIDNHSLSLLDWLVAKEELDFTTSLFSFSRKDMPPELKRLHLEIKIANCSKRYRKSLDPHSGRFRAIPQLCDQFNHNEFGLFCLCCLDLRKREFHLRILRALQSNPASIQITELLPDEADSLVRKLKKHDYFRCPQANGLHCVFYKTEPCDQPLTLDALGTLDWTLIAQTPEGQRVSGDLGKEDKQEDEDGTGNGNKPVEITQYEVTTEAIDPKQEQAVLVQSLREIAHQCPSTPEAVEEVLSTWANTYARLIRARGGQASIHERRAKVYPEQINWAQFNSLSHFARIGELNHIDPPT